MPDFKMPNSSAVILRSRVEGDVDDRLRIAADGTFYVGTGSTAPSARSFGGQTLTQVSVKESPFNAVGNGIADDTVAIQAAIDTVALTGGGDVLFPIGTYLTSAALYLRGGTRLIGNGKVRSIIKASAAHTDHVLRTPVPSTGDIADIVVDSLEIDGNRAVRGPLGVSSIGILTFAPSGTPNKRVTIRNCYVHDTTSIGIANTEVEGLQVINNEVADTQRDGITTYGASTNVYVAGNWVHGALDDYIAVNGDQVGYGSPSHVVVANNRIGPSRVKAAFETYFGSGLTVRGAQDVVVKGNVIDSGYYSGIALQNGTGTHLQDVVVSDNALSNAGDNNATSTGYGISIEGGNLSSDFGVQRVKVSGNTIRSSRTHNVYVASYRAGGFVRDVEIVNNTINANVIAGARGISINQTNNNISDIYIERNRISNTNGNGLNIGDGSNTINRMTIRDNVIIDSGQSSASSGMVIDRVTTLTLLGNVATNRNGTTQTFGLALTNTNGQCQMHGNNFLGNLSGEVTQATNTGASFYTQANSGLSLTLQTGLRHATGILDLVGSGTPEAVVTAPVGSTYRRSNGAAATCLYVKESGTGNTGWVAK